MRTRRAVVGVVLGLVLSGCTAQGASEPSPTPTPTPTEPEVFTVSGVVEVDEYYGVEGVEDGDSCITRGGYGDVEEGLQVTVGDNTGAALGVGELDAGEISADACVFEFEVDDVPEGETIYELEVGSRGVLTYKRADLNAPLRLGF